MKTYETTFILDPQMGDAGWEGAITKYSALITREGTIQRTEKWGLRRMTYPIKKRTQGYYVHIIHDSPTATPKEVERQFLLDENCLRYLIVVSDNPRYLEEMDKRKAAQESASESDAAAHTGFRERPARDAGAAVAGTDSAEPR